MNKHLLTILVSIFLFGCALGSTTIPGEEEGYKYTKEGWPANVYTAVYDILKEMDEESKIRVKETPKDDLILFHHGWGTGIRNAYGLWKGNSALIQSACGRDCHPDDASMVIIEAVWASLNEKP